MSLAYSTNPSSLSSSVPAALDHILKTMSGRQALVLLDDPSSVPDALECVSVADVFVASESAFSQASVTLSKHVKVRDRLSVPFALGTVSCVYMCVRHTSAVAWF